MSVGDLVRMEFDGADTVWWGLGVVIEIAEDSPLDDVCVLWSSSSTIMWEMASLLKVVN